MKLDTPMQCKLARMLVSQVQQTRRKLDSPASFSNIKFQPLRAAKAFALYEPRIFYKAILHLPMTSCIASHTFTHGAGTGIFFLKHSAYACDVATEEVLEFRLRRDFRQCEWRLIPHHIKEKYVPQACTVFILGTREYIPRISILTVFISCSSRGTPAWVPPWPIIQVALHVWKSQVCQVCGDYGERITAKKFKGER